MEFKFKKEAKSIASSEQYYDLFEGGYLDPEDFLEDDKQIKEVNEAISIVANYLSSLEEEGLLEEC